MVTKQTKIVPKRIKFVRKNYIVTPILSAISDGGAEADKRGGETEKLVPKTPKLEVSKRVATYKIVQKHKKIKKTKKFM